MIIGNCRMYGRQPHRVGGGALRRDVAVVLTSAALLASAAFGPMGSAAADPAVDEIAPPLPAVVPTASNWQPKFPFPFDQTRNSVTEADVNAEREMCQWYNAQYDSLMTQIDDFGANLARSTATTTLRTINSWLTP